jgi:hypothetical protein
MPDEPSADDLELATRLFAEWDHGRGTSKSAIERREWGDGSAHGRRFDRFIRQTLGVATNRTSKQADRIGELEHQLRKLGHEPIGRRSEPWQQQVQHARAAMLAALRVWNDPTATFRTGAFSLLFVAAWNSLAIALLLRRGQEWRELDSAGNPKQVNGQDKARDTSKLIGSALADPGHRGLRENTQRWLDLRNLVAHRHLPTLDLAVIPLAQAGLLNFEKTLGEEFGDDYLLAESLSVPLQLSGFRDPGVLRSLKQLQASLPLDVQQFLAKADSAPADILADPAYMLRVAFIPVVPISGRSPDAVAYFVKPDEVPESLAGQIDEFVVLPKLGITPRPNLSAKRVVAAVAQEIPFSFNVHLHTLASRRLQARPATSDGDQSKTDQKYCEYVPAAKLHLYNQAWVDRLVDDLSTEDGFRAATGTEPQPKAAEPDASA